MDAADGWALSRRIAGGTAWPRCHRVDQVSCWQVKCQHFPPSTKTDAVELVGDDEVTTWRKSEVEALVVADARMRGKVRSCQHYYYLPMRGGVGGGDCVRHPEPFPPPAATPSEVPSDVAMKARGTGQTTCSSMPG